LKTFALILRFSDRAPLSQKFTEYSNAVIRLTQTKHDIRDVNWGRSLSQVKSAEKFQLLNETANGLSYEGKLNNSRFDLMYSFIDHKLVRVVI
jgi:hypothetical protein